MNPRRAATPRPVGLRAVSPGKPKAVPTSSRRGTKAFRRSARFSAARRGCQQLHAASRAAFESVDWLPATISGGRGVAGNATLPMPSQLSNWINERIENSGRSQKEVAREIFERLKGPESAAWKTVTTKLSKLVNGHAEGMKYFSKPRLMEALAGASPRPHTDPGPAAARVVRRRRLAVASHHRGV